MKREFNEFISWMETKVKNPPPRPTISFPRITDYSGLYSIGPNHIEISTGMGLTINEKYAVLAHEWRHAWQWHNKKWIRGLLGGNEYNFRLPYSQAVVEYYREQPWEMDALKWACKICELPEDIEILELVK